VTLCSRQGRGRLKSKQWFTGGCCVHAMGPRGSMFMTEESALLGSTVNILSNDCTSHAGWRTPRHRRPVSNSLDHRSNVLTWAGSWLTSLGTLTATKYNFLTLVGAPPVSMFLHSPQNDRMAFICGIFLENASNPSSGLRRAIPSYNGGTSRQ
jgi:hypothetical protein